MSAIPCTYAINCDGSDFPITNYSAEAPEQVPTFTSLTFPEGWDKMGCLKLCVSEISQADADLCALSQAAQCNPPTVFNFDDDDEDEDGGEDPDIPTTSFVFFNTEQECSVPCSQTPGHVFTFIVPAGTFSAGTQLAADARANAYACKQALENILCIGDLTNDGACAGNLYNGVVGILSLKGVLIAQIVEGALPDGITFSFNDQSFTVSGNTSNPGQYDFRVKVDDIVGNTAEKDFSLFVVAISPDTIPNGTVGTPYTVTFSTVGPTEGLVTWSASPIPAGLTLNALTGQLSGTPTEAFSGSIVATFTDER